MVQALESIGVCVQTSCEQGVCGTCLTRVIDGEPEHRDQYLTPEEQADLVAFLRSLTDEAFVTDPRLGPPP